jgi:hypothetical protein
MSSQLEALRQSWSRAMTSLVWGHWLMVNTGIQTTQTLLATAVPDAPRAPPTKTAGVVALASARLKQGLAPPREAYQAPYRNQIDWSQFPDWARPCDPELFEGCGHEG